MTTTLAKAELPTTAAASRLGRLGAPNVQIAYRIAGIEVRKAFTDSLKAFCQYVDEEGKASSGGKGIYIQLSRRINVVFGLSRELQASRHFLRNPKWVHSDFGSKKLATTMPSAARARPASATARYFAALASHHGYHTGSTPVRFPYVLSPPAMEPQTSTKHPGLRLRGGRRTSLRCAPFPVLLHGSGLQSDPGRRHRLRDIMLTSPRH